jgi:hypothetical protein
MYLKVGRLVYYRRADIRAWLAAQLRNPAAAVIILFLISAAMAVLDGSGTANAPQGVAVATLVRANDNTDRVVGSPASGSARWCRGTVANKTII